MVIASIILFSSFIVFVVFMIFKTIYYRSKNYKDYINILCLITIYLVLYLTFNKLALIWTIIFSCLIVALDVFMIIDLFRLKSIDNAFHHKSNQLIKNAPFDYYLCTNQKDLIIDFSESFKTLVALDDNDLYKQRAFQTLLSTLNIKFFNNERFNETKAVQFDYEYRSTEANLTPRFFEITIEKEDEDVTLSIVIEPIFLNNKFIGRNIYLSENNKDTLQRIELALLDTKEMIQDDRATLYCMMSMMDDVLMFYDYHCSKYLLTEKTAKELNTVKRELTVNEFISLIHPQDLTYFQEQSEVITSIEVTRLRYRIKLGKEYIKVCDDTMYLNKESNLISIIRKDEKPEPVTEIVNEEKPNVDYKLKLEDTLRALQNMLDE